jgi:hypothetical protein
MKMLQINPCLVKNIDGIRGIGQRFDAIYGTTQVFINMEGKEHIMFSGTADDANIYSEYLHKLFGVEVLKLKTIDEIKAELEPPKTVKKPVVKETESIREIAEGETQSKTRKRKKGE